MDKIDFDAMSGDEKAHQEAYGRFATAIAGMVPSKGPPGGEGLEIAEAAALVCALIDGAYFIERAVRGAMSDPRKEEMKAMRSTVINVMKMFAIKVALAEQNDPSRN